MLSNTKLNNVQMCFLKSFTASAFKESVEIIVCGTSAKKTRFPGVSIVVRSGCCVQLLLNTSECHTHVARAR